MSDSKEPTEGRGMWLFSRRDRAAKAEWKSLTEDHGLRWNTPETAFIAGFHRGVNVKERESEDV